MFSTSNRVHATSGPTNLALNTSRTGFPEASASYECCGNHEDSPWNAVNGTFYYKGNEPRDRWTNYGGSQTDWLAIDFGSAKSFNQVKLYIYNDGGGVQPPASYLVQYWNGSAWIDTTNSTNTPATPMATIYTAATPQNTLNTVNFDTVTSPKLKIIFTNGGSYIGVVELEVFLHDAAADQSAAAAMMTTIGQLHIPADVVLSDKTAIAAARSAYDILSDSQKSLVTNLSRLTDAEAAIAALEAIPRFSNAVTNGSGNEIMITFTSLITDHLSDVDINKFHLNSASASIDIIELDASDRHNILLKLDGAINGHEDVTLTLDLGAVKDATYTVDSAGSTNIAVLNHAAVQPPSDPPVSISFGDSNSAQGKIGGTVTLVQPLNRTDIAYYSLFWGDNTGAVLPNRSAIAKTKAQTSNSNVTFSISDLAIPTDAVNLIAYAYNGAGYNTSGAVLPIADVYDTKPSRTYSSITGATQESGSKNVLITFSVRNAANESLKQFIKDNFTLNIPDGNVEHWTGLDNVSIFSNFTNHLDGTYSFVYTGPQYGTMYHFKFLTAHYNPANDNDYISIQDNYDINTPVNPKVTTIDGIAHNGSASSISLSDLLSVLNDLDSSADLKVGNLAAYQTAISTAEDSALNTSISIHQMVLDVNAAVAADKSAAAIVMSAIQTLPAVESISLSDKSAVAAARSAYDILSGSQKSLVTNLSILTDAEAAISTLEAALIPGVKEVTVLSAFSNATGNTITLKLASVLDITYSMQAANFAIIVNDVSVSVASTDYDSADSSHRTIKLTLSTPALLNATFVRVSLQSGALKTSNNELNSVIHSIPVITFKNLDLSRDNLIGVDDVVQMIVTPASQIDVNQDGVFNREDVVILLGQISMH